MPSFAAPGARVFAAVIVAVALVLASSARSAEAQSSSECRKSSPIINRRALRQQPPAVGEVVTALVETIKGLELNLPGLSVSVVIDQDVVFAAGFGCARLPQGKQRGIPATPDTFYRIESVTKVFEGIMLMQERDRQRGGPNEFALTDPVANLVPPVFFQVSNGFSSGPYYPTYLQLASHSSGLSDFLPTDLTTVGQFWSFLQQEVVRSDTVNAYSYSDQGFVAVGQAVAIIADPQNASYHDYVTENILLPLDMSGSTFDYTEISATRRASPYRLQDSAFVLDPSGNIANFPLAGNVWTTAVEMAQIISLQFRTAPVARDSQILACKSIQEMWEPVVSDDAGGYATIGWFLVPFQGQFLISKNGGSATWATLVRFLPDKRLGVIAFTNVGGDGPQADLVKLEKIIFEALAPLLPSQLPVCIQPPGGPR